MQKLKSSVNSFKEEIIYFIRESTVNEVKIALIINTIITIFLSFKTNNVYEILKYVAVTWAIILTACTLLLRTTTREVVKERHEKMYNWLTSKFSNVSLIYISIYVTVILAAFIIIFSKVTLIEVIILIKLNGAMLVGTFFCLKNSWDTKYITPFLSNNFCNLSMSHHVSAICGSLSMYFITIYLDHHKFSIIDSCLCVVGGYLVMFILLFVDKKIRKKETV